MNSSIFKTFETKISIFAMHQHPSLSSIFDIILRKCCNLDFVNVLKFCGHFLQSYYWSQKIETQIFQSGKWVWISMNTQYFRMVEGANLIYTFWRFQKFWSGDQKFRSGPQNILRSLNIGFLEILYFLSSKNFSVWSKKSMFCPFHGFYNHSKFFGNKI